MPPSPATSDSSPIVSPPRISFPAWCCSHTTDGRSSSGRTGLADRDASRANTPDTTFALGSVSKMFTAVLVAQLVEQDRVRLDATIGSLLPDFPDGPAKSQVTVHQLLTMSSGIPDVFRLPPFWTALAGARTLSDFWPVFGAAPLEFTPGSKWAYSNSNFLVLGAIVEHGFGEAFTTAAERRVFLPAGLAHTSYRAAPSSHPARGYTHLRPGAPLDSTPDPGRWYPAWEEDTGTADPVAAPMGGGYSTAGDLVRFADAVTGAQLLKRPASERIHHRICRRGLRRPRGLRIRDASHEHGSNPRTPGCIARTLQSSGRLPRPGLCPRRPRQQRCGRHTGNREPVSTGAAGRNSNDRGVSTAVLRIQLI